MILRHLAIVLVVSLFAFAGSAAQGIRVAERFPLGAADSVVTLSHEFIVPGSLHLMLDSLPILGTPGEFTLDARFGILRLGPDLRACLNDSSGVRHLTAEYNYRPLAFPREYYGRKLVTVNDSVSGPRVVAQPPPDLSGSGIFGRNLQRSGSIVRGFTLGTNRDLTVQSGLRLQFSGFVTDDVEVLGALTDEQTPIQPEGNTQTLREVDNIFMEIRAKSADAVLGKFIATNTSGSYTSYSRKLQGVKGVVYYSNLGSTEAVVGIAPGRFRTQAIQGQDRNQGPYRLTGENGERNIVLVAGSERVYVDGATMVRGENNDYVIDYSTGEIFFQTRRPITALSRITVDFEYSERQYSRTFVAVKNSNYFADSTITLSATYLRESDNPDATIDVTLTDADRSLLAHVGGDRTRAVRTGVLYVGRNDTVRGTYIRIDTTINGLPDSVYRYAPDDPAAVYNVAFSVSPTGIGDYRYVAFGQYEYAGKGLGTYLPVIYLPLPELRQVGAITLTARPAAGVSINAEAAYSDASLNRFSTDPSATLRGGAFTLSAAARRDTLRIAGTALGSVRFGASAQYLGASFQTLERVGEVDFTNRWNAGERPGTGQNDNLIVEDTLLWSPLRRVELRASNGLLRQGSAFHSIRQQYSGRFIGDTLIPGADYTFELITTDTAGARHSNWLRQRGGADYSLGAVTPAFRFEAERREDRASAGNLLPLSYRFVEAGPELRITLPFMTGTLRARYRTEDSARYDTAAGSAFFVRDGATQTYSMSGELRGVRDLSSTIEFTYRRRTYDSVAGADPAGRLNNTTVLARSQTRWSGFNRGLDFDALYEVQTEQAARLQRVFVRVPLGRGDFTWTDLNGDGVQSEDEFRPALLNDGEYVRIDLPTERLYPVIDLRTSTRLRLQPQRVIGGTSWLGRLLAPVTAETTLRLEEKSQDERESDIYLLRFSHFLNDSTTINGTALVQQDINLFESNPDYSFRFRVQSSYGLQRLVSTIERTENVEHSLRIRWQPTFDVGLQVDVAGNHGLLYSTDTTSTRRFDLTGFSVSNDLSYRPTQPLEVGWMLKLMSSRDVLPIIPRTTFLNTNSIRATYALATQGRLNLEVERTNVSGTNIGGDALLLPYQLTNGYAIGTTWTARAGLDYRFGANLQASINYTGRAQPPSMRVLHIGQAEVRAFF